MSEPNWNTQREQVERLKTLKGFASQFTSAAEKLWWHATNGYGKSQRKGHLQDLRDDLLKMTEIVDRLIVEETGAE